MKVVYTTEALADLDGILSYVAKNYPAISEAFENRLHAVVARIARWPESAQEVDERPGVRMVPLVRYPYKIFYQLSGETVEILYVHHAAREETR
jgi:plasmid stabilization system protein ParE